MMLNEVGRRYNICSGPTIMQEMFQRHEVKTQRSVFSLVDRTMFKIKGGLVQLNCPVAMCKVINHKKTCQNAEIDMQIEINK